MEARDIILRPIVTEQSMAEMDNRKYTFEVAACNQAASSQCC